MVIQHVGVVIMVIGRLFDRFYEKENVATLSINPVFINHYTHIHKGL